MRESGPGGCAHACELETSMYLHIDGERVRKDRIEGALADYLTDLEGGAEWQMVDLTLGSGPGDDRRVDVLDHPRRGRSARPSSRPPRRGASSSSAPSSGWSRWWTGSGRGPPRRGASTTTSRPPFDLPFGF